MQLTNKEKADKLREAIALLNDVDCLQQTAIAEMNSDVCYEIHNKICSMIDDFYVTVEELETE